MWCRSLAGSLGLLPWRSGAFAPSVPSFNRAAQRCRDLDGFLVFPFPGRLFMVIDRFMPEGKRPYWRLEAEGCARGSKSHKRRGVRAGVRPEHY